MTTLGRLERLPLRDIWHTEAQHFTPWLAREDNLALLGETLGLDLELEATEKDVGPFRADILCKDTDDGSWVLIENQIERTDHVHMGQLLTYAAGLKAVTIIWVASLFTEEHRAALDWLNEITEDSFRFFGVEVELWRIGQSPAAPKFNVVSKPNAWSKSVSRGKREIDDTALSQIKLAQRKYWEAFADALRASDAGIRPQKPSPQHWMNMSIGRTGFLLGALVNSNNNTIGVELVMTDDDAKAHFHLLKAEKEEIERAFGAPLEWYELPDRKFTRIIYRRADTDFTRESEWEEQHAWLIDHLKRLRAVFGERVKRLDATDWPGGEAEPALD